VPSVTPELPDDHVERPSGESSRWLVLVIVCLAQFMVVLDATVVNVALPRLAFGARSPRVAARSGWCWEAC